MSPDPSSNHDPACPDGLERLGWLVLDHAADLLAFYLVVRAYEDGARSLHAVAEELRRRKDSGWLPDKIPTSTSALSGLLFRLAAKVFARYYEKPYLSLLSCQEGKHGVLSEDGRRAGEATREFLARNNSLPRW